jgi:hypothetical protein
LSLAVTGVAVFGQLQCSCKNEFEASRLPAGKLDAEIRANFEVVWQFKNTIAKLIDPSQRPQNQLCGMLIQVKSLPSHRRILRSRAAPRLG